ncbi:Terminase, large subunit [Pseudomonas caricapapayae]|uniref:Terminase, large subunit n=1 Tax=Pseudomonas caricapapayae TaxID=46678 RepID=A0A3M6FD43_9PSED|nr:Terminase, large subunit [Pseudomonas caricapapayae]
MVYVDEWASDHMWVSQNPYNDRPSPYQLQRTPFAKGPMRCLSQSHPCKRIVVMAAWQMMKTQVAINWIGSMVHSSPANILALLPTHHLALRLNFRIDKAFKVTPTLRGRLTTTEREFYSRSFEGGSLRVLAAASLACQSLAADYIYGENIDFWPDVDQGGDLIEVAERCHETSIRKPKFYFSGTPTRQPASRIESLFLVSDQRHYYLPCPNCRHMQTLEWERLHYSSDFQTVHYQCSDSRCGASITEQHLGEMLLKGEWRSHSEGDGETVGFHLNALYAPSGCWGWARMAKQYERAKKSRANGDVWEMKMFYNHMLARSWDEARD